jgi:hypothetical protein
MCNAAYVEGQRMNEYQLMQIWRGIKYPQKEVEQRVLEFGRQVMHESSDHYYQLGRQEAFQAMKPVLLKALSALDSAHYILMIQPVTPREEALAVDDAIKHLSSILEVL